MKSASLNHIYRLVWNEITQAYVAVPEHACGRGKRTSGVAGVAGALAAVLLVAAGGAAAQALPTGAQIAAGTAGISQSANQLTVTQTSQRLVTNWRSFDIGAGASVRFDQPNASSIALNRVTGGGAASAIDGQLSANGNVWVLNPNGVVFGRGAQVNVGGLVASSLGISDADFLAGRTRLSGAAGAGAVTNLGDIRTAPGGVVALVAPRVSNAGSISTPGGSTVLAAGEAVSLDFVGDGLVNVKVERGALDAAAENSGQISAAGGLVHMTARSADALMASVVNNTGRIEAKGLVARNGRILLDGDAQAGETHVSGVLDASSDAGQGGSIAVTGQSIRMDGGARLDASGNTGGGTIRVGGGWQGQDASIANAGRVDVDATVQARADGLVRGNGGEVVFWSDGSTRFAGDVSARGGELAGDGGRIEVSGKSQLNYSGRANALAPHGATGDLLLDPATLSIQGGGSGSGLIDGSVVYEKDLEAQQANVLLQATGNVTVADLNLNGGDGAISMANNVSLRIEGGTTGSGNVSFANASNTLEVFGTGSLMMVAGSTGTGTITNAPNLIAHGAGTNPATLPTHTVTSVGSGTPGAGSVTLFGADGVTVGGSITTNGGYVRVWADSDNQSGGGYSMSAPVSTSGGNFYVSAGTGDINLNSNMTLGTGRIVFRADGSYTNGTKRLGGVLSASGAVNVDTPFVMNAGAGIYTDGTITFSNTVNLNTGAGALTLRASAIDFNSATLNNLGNASMVLQPWDPATSIVIGDATGFASTSTLQRLDGIKNLTIGRADGTGTTTVPASGFTFNVGNAFSLLNGNVDIQGALVNSSATGRVIAQAAQDVTIGAGGSVTASGAGNAITLAAGRDFLNSNASASALSAANGRWLVYSTQQSSNQQGALVNDFKQYNARFGGNAATDAVLGAGNGFLYTIAPVISVSLTGEVRKTYDGTNAAVTTNANFASTGAIDGDQASFRVGGAGSATYDSKNADTGKRVDVTGIAIDSATNGNVQVYGYQYNSTSSANVGVVDQRVLQLASNGGVSATAADKVYDGDRTATVTGVSFANIAQGDVLSATATGTFDTRNAGGGKTVTVDNIQVTGAAAANYDFSAVNAATTTAVASISQRTVGATASITDKVYDGTTNASVSNVVLSNVVQGDNVASALASHGTFDSRNVGSNRQVTANGVQLTGADAGNYRVDTAAVMGTASITPRTLTATAQVTDKVYDGNTTAALGQIALQGVVGNDLVSGAGQSTGSFDNRNAGTGKSVTGSGIVLAGADAGNYQVDASAVVGTGNITPRVITATGQVADKVYDGNTVATLGSLVFHGVLNGDQLQNGASSTGTFDSKDVGARTVTGIGISLAGADAGNYTLDSAAIVGNARITPRQLMASASVGDKVYDGSTAAQLSGVRLSGVVAGEEGLVAAVGSAGSFDSRNVGTGRSVSGSGLSITGSGAGNYSFDSSAQVGTASITPKLISATGQVDDKVYDGNTVATLSNLSLAGIVAGDRVSAAAGSLGSFDTRQAGTGKAVSASGVQLAGDDAGNYAVDTAGIVGTGNIARRVLVASGARVDDKTYDGNTNASVSGLVLTGVVAGDQVLGSGGTGRFDSAAAGNGKRVQVTALGLTGADADNYTLAQASVDGTATIRPQVDATPAALVAPQNSSNSTATAAASALSGAQGGAAASAGAAAPVTQISSALVQGNAAGTAVNTAASSAASNAGSGNAGAGVAGGAAGGTQPLLLPDAVLTSGGRLSLAVEDAKPSEPVKSSIQIFSSRSGETVAKGDGQYSFVDQGSTVSLALEGGATRSAPQVQASGAQTAEGAVPLGTGGVMTLRVSLQSDETLAVEVPSAGSTLGSEAITAYALTVAKKRFGLSPQGVKAVVVQYL